jgi:hypothetical protein
MRRFSSYLPVLVCGGPWLSFPTAGASAQGSAGNAVRFAHGDFAGLFGIGDGRRMYRLYPRSGI